MAERDTRRVVHDLMDEPRIAGRRISARQVYALVEERGVDPEPAQIDTTWTWRTSTTRSRTITTTHGR